MEIDEKKLRELVIKAIELIQAENSKKEISTSKKKLYVILMENWNSKYWNFFESLSKQNEYEVHVVINSKINSSIHVNNLKKFNVCSEVINEENVDYDELKEYITVFPTITRNIVVKTALCINDTLETNWILKSMEKGQRIVLLNSGLERFTGKEPLAYINTILEYYKKLLEFNIEISEKLSMDTCNYDFKINQDNTNYNIGIKKENICSGKRIITSSEVEKYRYEKKIVLNHGDIITDMAKEKAQSLNISIIR